MIELITVDGRYLAFKASGKLEPSDYEELAKHIEATAERQKITRVILLLDEFHGWTLPGAAAAIKFGIKDGHLVEKLGIIGAHTSDEALAWVVEVFGSTIVEFFEPGRGEDAWKWLHADETGEYLSFASFGSGAH